jgi:hypothetical protein
VTGAVRITDGTPVSEARLTLDGREVPLQPDGSFVAAGVAAGDHGFLVSDAGRRAPGSPRLWGQRTITVANDDLSDIVIPALRAGPVRGRLVFESGQPPQNLRPGAISLAATPTPTGSTQSSLRWNSDWTFDLTDAVGTYLFRTPQQPSGFALKAVLLAGRDVTDTPIEIDSTRQLSDLQVVVTDRLTDVSGRVTDGANADASEYVVVMFPEERSQWTPQSRFIVTARPDQQGRFRIAGLPAGRYLAAAVAYLEPGEERYAPLLGRLTKIATSLTLAEGEARSVTLRLEGK